MVYHLGAGQLLLTAPMRIVLYIQNKMFLEFHLLYWLTDLSAFWNFVVRLNEDASFFTACHVLCYPIPAKQRSKLCTRRLQIGKSTTALGQQTKKKQ